MRAVAPFLLLLSILPAPLWGGELVVGEFSRKGLAGWEEKRFSGKTSYRLVQEDGVRVVEAVSRGSASGMIRTVEIDPKRYRYLRWRWKVAGTIPGGDERTKQGDDYAARVYLVFPGRFFWQTTGITYIWGNRLHRGGAIPNAYTKNVMMVAVESGNDRAGEWVEESRDIVADYRRLFGTDPPPIGAVAIMTDTDTTGAEGRAWYGDIVFSESPSPR